MMDREELIEEARRAYLDAWAATSLADVPPGTRSRNGIIAALAVFEKAHAPTDDERGAISNAFDEMHRITEGGCDTRSDDVADMVLGLGFRRSEVPEPTATKEHHPVGAYLPVGQLDGDCSCGDGEWPCKALTEVPEPQGEPTPFNGKWVCGKCAREVALGHDDGQIPEHHRTCPKRTQDEPSDAQVEAAADAIRWASEHGGWESMARAALRAAEKIRLRSPEDGAN